MRTDFKDLTGQKFSRLTIISYSHTSNNYNTYWNCLCECGRQKVIIGSGIKSGKIKSCGCLNSEKRKEKLIDLTGKIFGYWVVLEKINKQNSDGKHPYWRCKCKCGNIREVAGGALKSGNSKSCGCYRIEIASQVLDNNEAIKNELFYRYKKRAEQKKIAFDLTYENFLNLIDKSCFYCGVEQGNIKKSKTDSPDYEYNGVDRVDSNLGYTLGNVRTCCKDCNYAKNVLSEQEFIILINNIYKNFIIKNGYNTD